MCGAVTALLHGAANLTSSRAGRGGRPVRRVREEPRADAPRHADASRRGRGDRRRVPGRTCSDAARRVWDEVLAAGRVHGFRNAQATVLAPTGTISFMMDCDTTGIEPDIALVKYKQLAGGGMLKIVNQTVPLALDDARLRPAADRLDPGLHRRARHDRRRARPEGRAPRRLRLRVHAAQRQAVDRLAGPRPDDGRRPAVPLRRDLEDGQHAARHHGRGHRQGVLRRLEARPQGAGHLPRRLEGKPAAGHRAPKANARPPRPQRRQAAPRTAARHAAERSRTSSASPATRATSPSACSPTAGRASCSSRWPRKAARSAA